MSLIYNYQPATGEYMGRVAANVSPREPDVILVPAFATSVAPPAVSDRQCACYLDAAGKAPADYQDGAWQVVADWRGVPLWSTARAELVAITTPGVTPEDIGATGECPPNETSRYVDGEWVPDDDKIDMKNSRSAQMVRTERDRLLRDVYDPAAHMLLRLQRTAPPELQAAIAAKLGELDAYAQALQDVPEQEGFPNDIIWPTVPAKEL